MPDHYDEQPYRELITGRGPRAQAVERGAIEDLGLQLDNAPRAAGSAVRAGLAFPVAAAVDTAERVGSDIYEGAVRPTTEFLRGLTGVDSSSRRTPARVPADPVPTPETARPNAPTPEPTPEIRVTRQGAVDTSRFPYGLDLARLQAQFPAAINAPANVRNGLAARRPVTDLPARQRPPEREDNRDLQAATQNIIAQLGAIPGGSGGFGDLLRYRLGLGAAAANLIPVASERARRDQAYQDAVSDYTRETDLGLRLADLGLDQDRLGLAGEELDQRALDAERNFGLDRFDSQARLQLGLAALAQRDQAARASAAATLANRKYQFFDTEAVDPETGQVVSTPNLFLGVGPGGAPITRSLGPEGIVDPLDELLSGVN